MPPPADITESANRERSSPLPSTRSSISAVQSAHCRRTVGHRLWTVAARGITEAEPSQLQRTQQRSSTNVSAMFTSMIAAKRIRTPLLGLLNAGVDRRRIPPASSVALLRSDFLKLVIR